MGSCQPSCEQQGLEMEISKVQIYSLLFCLLSICLNIFIIIEFEDISAHAQFLEYMDYELNSSVTGICISYIICAVLHPFMFFSYIYIIFFLIFTLEICTLTITFIFMVGMRDHDWGSMDTEYNMMTILGGYQCWMILIHFFTLLDHMRKNKINEKRNFSSNNIGGNDRNEEDYEPVTFVNLHSEIAEPPPPYEVAVKF